ncbi:PLDc N-terminal domain-containing protein [Nocardioides rubriscoriae]|uniref:PLDc N-terminal domain-containing protein n=1 Tax=Nocardioides rubriscoriae TaxID=642762 RepID=UPI001FE38772|nr:PLDc N-terminal domain-containing protein [Nocardioides rubriscoriae]
MSIPDWLPSGSWLATLVVVLVALAGLALRIAAIGIIPGNRKPSTGMAWLLLILLTPWLGLVAFVFFGSTQVGARRRERQAEINAAITERARTLATASVGPEAPAYLRSVVALNQRLGALPLLSGNRVALVPDYAGSVGEMTAAVEAAETYVNVEFYIAAWDEVTAPFFEALVAATARGVTVRLLFDHLGSRRVPGYRDLLARLAATDIAWHPMLPVRPFRGRFRRPDLRNHRKLVVVDGRVGFTARRTSSSPATTSPPAPTAASGSSSSCASRARSWPSSTRSSPPTGTPRPTRSCPSRWGRTCARPARSAPRWTR